MMVIIKARLGTIAPPEKRVGFDLPASVTVPTAVRSLRRTRPGVSRRPDAPDGDLGRGCHRSWCMMWWAPKALAGAIQGDSSLCHREDSGGDWFWAAPGGGWYFHLLAELVLIGEKSSDLGHPHEPKCSPQHVHAQCIRHAGRRHRSVQSPGIGAGQRRRTTEGALQLQLRVVTSQSFLGAHDVAVGETNAGVSVGQTSGHLVTTVERLPGLRPTRCVVTFQVFGTP